MKHFSRVLVLCVVGLFVQVSIASAAVQCTVEIQSMGPNGFWAANVTDAPCGTQAVGAWRNFTLDPAQKDRLLAIALTAMSLQKTLWINALGDVNGSIVDNMAMAK